MTTTNTVGMDNEQYHKDALNLMQEQSRKVLHGWPERNQKEKASFVAGANFGFYELPKLLPPPSASVGDDVREALIKFFIWFRDKGGEDNIGKSIEKMIDEYLKQAKS